MMLCKIHAVCLSLLICTLLLESTGADFFCFKKVHKERRKESICRGLIEKHGQPFRSPRGCCRNGGVGYYESLEALGKRGKKYVCKLCNDRQSRKQSSETPAPSLFFEATTHTEFPSTGTTSTVTARPLVPDLILPVRSASGWSSWSNWTTCSLTCGMGTRQRQRICYGDICFGSESEKEFCTLARDCPVDGHWGPWQGWSGCSSTCGGGIKKRQRLCNDPPPKYNGRPCPGDEYDILSCNVNGCPVDGGWSDWFNITTCSTSCGKGLYTQKRTCTNPVPQYGGRDCSGRSEENKACVLPKCPVDGDWSLWTNWTPCNISCGNSTRARHRECEAPKPRHGGKDCEGDGYEEEACFALEPCPVDGNWAEWGPWGPCLAIPCKGERGNQTRSRTCTNPQPRFRGSMCMGSSNEIQECFNNYGCPVDGGWCEWSSFTICLPYDRGMFRRRTRSCSCPVPESGGLHCTGDDYEVESCSTDGQVLPCDKRQQLEGSGFIDADDEDC